MVLVQFYLIAILAIAFAWLQSLARYFLYLRMATVFNLNSQNTQYRQCTLYYAHCSVVGVLRYHDRDPITTINSDDKKIYSNNAEQNNLPLFKSEI